MECQVRTNTSNVTDKSEKYLRAMKDVKDGGLSTRKAAEKWGLKRTALLSRINGKVAYNRCKGPSPILTKSEEIADWLIEMSNRGFGVSKSDLLQTVKNFLDKDSRSTPFKNNKPGNKWFESYMKRNPQVKVQKARPLEKKKARITQEDVDKWFSEYQEFLLKKDLMDQPGQIWNCDETEFDLNGCVGKVIGPSKQKEAPYHVMSGNRECITMLLCFNASGQWMPPYFIFPGKRIPVTYNPLEGGVDGSVFSMTESGYMNTQTFYMLLANHFIPNLPPKRPVLLLVDSHDSHLDLATFELVEKKLHSLIKSGIYPLDKSEVSKGLLGPSNQSFDANQRVDKDSTSPSLQAFEALDAALSTPSQAKYRHRIEEGCDLNGSPTFSAWNKLYKSTNPSHVHHDGKGETSQRESETSQGSQHAEKAQKP
ncbi:tigger transposable element-derived 6 [Paramuricea clavata]|uniref:Tigger transposable element-derived 6, partial n=1 Tax=Paramuricea clavata TaxID=317549 RepID=A0A7D9HMU0_PARCT|nr:tigger transposable element-derived 6 [Paramuricea clavata]